MGKSARKRTRLPKSNPKSEEDPEAKQVCEGNRDSDECKVAWDEVEEVSQAKADLFRKLNENKDPLQSFVMRIRRRTSAGFMKIEGCRKVIGVVQISGDERSGTACNVNRGYGFGFNSFWDDSDKKNDKLKCRWKKENVVADVKEGIFSILELVVSPKACVKRIGGDETREKHCIRQYFDY